MTVRYRIRGESLYGHTEVVGVVQSVADEGGGRVAIIDKRGATHTVRVSDVVASKIIP